jgi:iron-sulfur cluster assembly accessory protein
MSEGIQLEVTPEAQSQVRTLIQKQKPGTAVRVYVQAGGGGGGGCGSGCGCGAGGGGGGTSLAMSFDRPRNGDQVIAVDGFSVLVDPMSAEFLNGAKIDFVQSLDASGFKITAPSLPEAPASGGDGCGCGSGGGGGCC